MRRGSEADWELDATGESFTLRMHYGNEPITNYFIMLRATDSEDLTGEDQIQIVYQRPPN